MKSRLISVDHCLYSFLRMDVIMRLEMSYVPDTFHTDFPGITAFCPRAVLSEGTEVSVCDKKSEDYWDGSVSKALARP